jgi:hypothetical protein
MAHLKDTHQMGGVNRKKAYQDVMRILEKVHAQQPPSTLSPREEEERIAREVKAFRKPERHETNCRH